MTPPREPMLWWGIPRARVAALSSLAVFISGGLLLGFPLIAFNVSQGVDFIVYTPLIIAVAVAAMAAFARLGPPMQGRAWIVFIGSAPILPLLLLTAGLTIASMIFLASIPTAIVFSLVAIRQARRWSR